MTELFQDSSNGLPLFEETEIQSKFVSHNDILQSRDMIYYEVYTSNKSTRTMVYSSSRPINYIRIKSKLQRTRYMLLPILTKHPYNQGKSNEFSRFSGKLAGQARCQVDWCCNCTRNSTCLMLGPSARACNFRNSWY